ncbi:hypothetical protein TsFJ059_005095 [Trichoderma semiorbis]|uniref:Uncharacterized protein n=1 Tax=Trichoderma semiorbis TaxID=1491008 RepID=A0A9P8KQP4_9HYPO|nr:hypothetical protein TsFJ059_005095 [Trichoderma semiorbis]
MLGTAPAPGIILTMERQRRKRKAETLDSDRERLSKRLSRLNIEPKSKLHVKAETPAIATASSTCPKPTSDENETMQVDDSKHKVYIYDLDAELSSDSENDDGKLVFLPDIEKHLRENRIPRHILANDEGELAGMQLVLYSDPKSLSVPEEKDSVRRAIIEARHRAREEQKKMTQPDEIPNNVMPPQMASQTYFQTPAVTMPRSDPAPAPFFHVDDPCDAMEVD